MTSLAIQCEYLHSLWITYATCFRNNKFVRHRLSNCKLPRNSNALHFAGGAVAQEVDSRGFYCAGRLEHYSGIAKAVGRELAQAYALHVKHVVILERVLF